MATIAVVKPVSQKLNHICSHLTGLGLDHALSNRVQQQKEEEIYLRINQTSHLYEENVKHFMLLLHQYQGHCLSDRKCDTYEKDTLSNIYATHNMSIQSLHYMANGSSVEVVQL